MRSAIVIDSPRFGQLFYESCCHPNYRVRLLRKALCATPGTTSQPKLRRDVRALSYEPPFAPSRARTGCNDAQYKFGGAKPRDTPTPRDFPSIVALWQKKLLHFAECLRSSKKGGARRVGNGCLKRVNKSNACRQSSSETLSSNTIEKTMRRFRALQIGGSITPRWRAAPSRRPTLHYAVGSDRMIKTSRAALHQDPSLLLTEGPLIASGPSTLGENGSSLLIQRRPELVRDQRIPISPHP